MSDGQNDHVLLVACVAFDALFDMCIENLSSFSGDFVLFFCLCMCVFSTNRIL